MKANRGTLLLVGMAVALSGCVEWEERPDGVSGGGAPFAPVGGRDVGIDVGEPTGSNDLRLTGGFLEGTIGDVRGFAGEAQVVQSYGYDTILIETSGPGWAAMAMLSASGGFERGGTDASGLGCSGPSSGVWEADVPAEQVEMVYEPGQAEGEARLDFVLRLAYGDTVSGFVTFE